METQGEKKLGQKGTEVGEGKREQRTGKWRKSRARWTEEWKLVSLIDERQSPFFIWMLCLASLT